MVSKTTSKEMKKQMEGKKMERKLAAKVVLRERRMLLPESVNVNTLSKRQVAAFCNILDVCTNHAYVAGKELIEALEKVSASDIKEYLDLFVETLNDVNCGGYDFNKLMAYSDYPKTELTAEDAEIYYRQFVSYITQAVDRFFDTNLHEEIFMSGEKIEKGEDSYDEYDTIKSVVVRPATISDAYRIVKAMIAGKTRLLPSDEDLLLEVLNNISDEEFLMVLPAKISQKTTLKMVAGLMLKRDLSIEALGIKNSIDALRLAHELSGSFNKFSLKNKERKAILSIIDKDKHAVALMFSKREEFLRLGETIHPGSYKNKYPLAYKAFQDLRNNNRSERTIMSQVNILLDNGDVLGAAEKLALMPGKFAQSLEQLLSLGMTETIQNKILDCFEEVVSGVNRKQLYQTYYFFKNRSKVNGQTTEKYKLDRYTRPLEYCKFNNTISEKILNRAAAIAFDGFAKSVADVEPASYFIDKDRFSNAIVDKIASRIKMRATDWLRLFVYWVGMDVDLSACFLDENFNYKGQVSWQCLRNKSYDEVFAVHSEDITYAPNGGNEYIDINRIIAKKKAAEEGYRYIAIVNFVFSGPSFNCMDDAFTGVMNIQNPTIGNTFKPSAVAVKTSVKSGTANLAYLYDIVEDVVIPVNADVSPDGSLTARGNTVARCQKEIISACKAIIGIEKFNLYDYLVDFVKITGGTMVENPDEADVKFCEDGIDIFDDILYSEYI